MLRLVNVPGREPVGRWGDEYGHPTNREALNESAEAIARWYRPGSELNKAPRRVPANQLWLHQVVDTLMTAVNRHDFLLNALMQKHPELLEQPIRKLEYQA